MVYSLLGGVPFWCFSTLFLLFHQLPEVWHQLPNTRAGIVDTCIFRYEM